MVSRNSITLLSNLDQQEHLRVIDATDSFALKYYAKAWDGNNVPNRPGGRRNILTQFLRQNVRIPRRDILIPKRQEWRRQRYYPSKRQRDKGQVPAFNRWRNRRSLSSISDRPVSAFIFASVSQRIQALPRCAWASRLSESSGLTRMTTAIEALSRRYADTGVRAVAVNSAGMPLIMGTAPIVSAGLARSRA
jgi:hypothetical protein